MSIVVVPWADDVIMANVDAHRLAEIIRATAGVDAAVADAFAATPRLAFVDPEHADSADV